MSYSRFSLPNYKKYNKNQIFLLLQLPNFIKMRSKCYVTFILTFAVFHFEMALDFELAKAEVQKKSDTPSVSCVATDIPCLRERQKSLQNANSLFL